MIADTVEPAVKSALDGYGLNGFKFEKVVLGQIPPRVTGIKVYDKNVGRNEIILDLVRLKLDSIMKIQRVLDLHTLISVVSFFCRVLVALRSLISVA